jgi:hypothetical protein
LRGYDSVWGCLARSNSFGANRAIEEAVSDGGRTEDRWSRYQRWNDALADVLYGHDSESLPVFLDLEEDVLARVAMEAGEANGNPRQALIEAVRPTLNPPTHTAGLFGRYQAPLIRWRNESGDPPPTLGILAVLALAAEDMHDGDGFSSHDYYNRLMPLLGVSNERDKKLVESAYRSCSKDLWGSLNNWLEYLDGRRGIPTAFSLGFAHVGLPISQAILRATDREKLLEFFEDYGFAPRSHLNQRDMELLLGEWVVRAPSPASNAMQTLWRRPGARSRIVEGACALLDSWDGPRLIREVSGRDQSRRRSAPIQVTALLHTFPTLALELNFTGPSSGSSEVILELIDVDGAVTHNLAIEPLTDRRWRLAEPWRIELSSILDGRICLRDSNGVLMERRPRRVVALTHDDLLQVFFEVERLPLGETAMIFCAQEVASSIEEALSVISRPGFKRLSSELDGLPPGWTLFTEVQVFTSLPATRPDGTAWEFVNDLNVLQPLASSQLVVEAGLRLPGHLRRWSSLAPPEIRVVTENSELIKIRISQVRDFGRLIDSVDTTFEGSAAIVRLADHFLPDGDFEIFAWNAVNGQIIDQVRIRLRSADVSSAVEFQTPLLLNRDPLWAVGAARSDASDVSEAVELPAPNDPPLRRLASTTVPHWWAARKTARGRVARAQQVRLPSVALEDCFRTGRHIIELPKYYGSRSNSGSTVEGVCRQCGIVKRYPAHYRASSTSSPSRPRYVSPTFDPARIAPVSERVIPPDVALDALCLDRIGNVRALEQVAIQIEPSQLFVDRYFRGLESLGHLEVRREARGLWPTQWEIATTALVQVKAEVFDLVGFRSQSFMALIEQVALEFGVRIERRSQEGASDRIRFRGCGVELADSIARRTFDETGVLPIVNPDAPLLIARSLPPLSLLTAALPRMEMIGYRSVNRWEEEIATWVAVDDASGPGAYQLFSSRSVYCLRDARDVQNGTMRQADVRLVKHIASSEVGFPLLGYEEETETLYAPLGAGLPGLYSRAAVLASGLLPSDDTEQRCVAYPSVSADLAALLIDLMSS